MTTSYQSKEGFFNAPTMQEHSDACKSLAKHALKGFAFIQLEAGVGMFPTAIYHHKPSKALYRYKVKGDSWATLEPDFLVGECDP